MKFYKKINKKNSIIIGCYQLPFYQKLILNQEDIFNRNLDQNKQIFFNFYFLSLVVPHEEKLLQPTHVLPRFNTVLKKHKKAYPQFMPSITDIKTDNFVTDG